MEVRSPLTRLLIVAAVLTVWAAGALGRLGYLQLFRYSEYLSRAEHQQQHIVEISGKRADIFDRNAHALAMSARVDSCFAVPSEIADPDMVSRLLGRVLNVSADEMATRLASSHSFVWIARKLPPETAARIAGLNLRGIYFQKEDERFYPKRSLAAPVLGYVDIDERGLGGVEYELDKEIRSKPGRMLIMSDAHSRWYDSRNKTPDAGASVVLTIDENIQYIAEKELATAISETHAKAGTVVVQDPANGEILAMASWPTFNPNAAGDVAADARMNRAVGALYEPGSVFKIVTLSAAIDQGITSPDEVVDCQMGAIYIAGHRIRDHKPFGNLTVAQILAHSSDVGSIKIGLRLGAPKFYDYIRAYGFGSLSGIDLPGENRGLLRRLENWTPISIGAVSMGQEVGVTPVQMITAVSAIANGGLLYRPHVVLALKRGTEETAMPEPAPRRVVQATTAATMRAMLEGVVLNGTGTRARLDGYTSAGKTGTAQKIDPATGRYSATQLIASFVGFAPINNAAVTILVQLDSPAGAHEGGSVAAPVFKRVAEQVLAYRNVPHDVALAPATLRAARNAGAAADAARDDVADFDPGQLDSADGGVASEQAWPTASEADAGGASANSTSGRDSGADLSLHRGGSAVEKAATLTAGAAQAGTGNAGAESSRTLNGTANATVTGNGTINGAAIRTVTGTAGARGTAAVLQGGNLPTVELAEEKTVTVPDFSGKPVREVIEICMKLGINPVLVGSGVVHEQMPGAGSLVRRGGPVTVRFGGSAGLRQLRASR